MAEIAQKRMENFAAAKLELQESKIFSEKELNKMLKKITKNEHKMAGIANSLDNYKSAINYERGLLAELKQRVRARSTNQKNSHLEWIFIKRIINYYQRGLKNFPPDYEFNLAFFMFLQYFPDQQHVTNNHVKHMIKVFGPTRPDIFKKVAVWFLQCDNINESREMLLRGQSLHPTNLEIYLDLIELEINNHTASEVQGRLKEYVKEIVKNNVTHRFLEEVLKIFDNYDNLKDVVDYAIEQLLNKYRNEEGIWHYIALRELRGKYYPSGDTYIKSTINSVKRAINRYKEGILKLPPDKKPLLWKMYLDTLVDLLKEYRNPQTIDFLKEALNDADALKIQLDESHYLAWIDCCEKNDILLVKKLKEGTQKHNTSIMLWSLYLKYYVFQDEWEFAKQVFEKALSALGPKADKIWELYLDFHLLKSPVAEIDALYDEAINQPHPEISGLFKPRYLAWTILSKGIEEARKLYLRIAVRPPYSKKLHEEMFLAELMEHGPNGTQSHQTQQVLDLWRKQFGADDHDVYFRSIDVVQERGGVDVNEKVAQIYEEAIKTLSDDTKVALFKRRFERM